MRKKILWLFERDCMPRTLWPLEWLAISYSILTTIFIPFLWPDMVHPWEMLSDRMFILAATFLLWGVWLKWPVRLMTFIRITVQMCLLNYWYPDTYEFNRTLPNLDHIFAEWESVLFGCQPSLEFSRLCPWGWFSEAVNMGYFSYYPMIVIVMVFFFLCRNRHYERASFVVMCSFFIYYLIYIWLPVAGPQFYFQAITPEAAEIGNFTALGTYFSHHTDMLPAPGDAQGFFYQLVGQAQDMGERPTAAFPSSHIGITLILLYLVWPQSRRMFFVLLPFAILLTMATVYIQAHYLIDSIAGVITSYPVFLLSNRIFTTVTASRNQ